MPHSIHTHKSMLLRGVQMPQPILERADIDATSAKAKNSGRSFGGVPFRGERNGDNRGGHINSANDRTNPFAAYVHPNTMASGPQRARGPPPPPGVHYQDYPPHSSGNHYPPTQHYQPHSRGYGNGYHNQQQPPPHNAYGSPNAPYDQSSGNQYYRR